MKIKVVKASKRTYWYANHIGEVFDVEKCKSFFQERGSNKEILIIRRYELRFEGETLRHFIHEVDTELIK